MQSAQNRLFPAWILGASRYGQSMRTFGLALVAALILVGCGNKDTPTPAPQAEKTGSTDYLSAVAKAKTNAEKTIDTVALNQQVQLFYAQEGRFPKDLNELVTEKYLKELPPAPMGMKITYDAAKGEVKVIKE